MYRNGHLPAGLGKIYISDLKVNQKYRQQEIAGNLIPMGLKETKKRGSIGLLTIGQDNTLAACQFYLRQGFIIGGLNTHEYNHTQQEGKSDVYYI